MSLPYIQLPSLLDLLLIFWEKTVIIVIARYADNGVLHFYRKRSRCKLGRFLFENKKQTVSKKTVCRKSTTKSGYTRRAYPWMVLSPSQIRKAMPFPT